MPIYDRMTPFEEQQQQQSPSPGGKGHKLEQRQYSGRAPISPGSQCFNVSTSGFNHPRPPTLRTLRPPTPNPLQPRVLELSNYSTHSSACEKKRSSPNCCSCGPISKLSGLNAHTNDCCVCADIVRESEGPDTPSSSSTDTFKPRSHVLPNHHHRRHSLCYEPILLNADHALGQIGPLFDPLRTESALIRMESNILEEECKPLETDSSPLEHEVIPLEEIHSYEDPYYLGAEERLSSHKVSLEDWHKFCRVQKARSEVWVENQKALPTSATQIQDNKLGLRRYPERQRAKDGTETTFKVSKEEHF